MSDASPGGGDFSGFDAGSTWSGSETWSGPDAGTSEPTSAGTPHPTDTGRLAGLAGVAGTARAGGGTLPVPRWVISALLVAVFLGATVGGIVYALTHSVEPGFGSPESISALLAERGAPCSDFSADSGEGKADERGACYVDGEKIIIATFDSREDVEAHWERQLRVAADNETVGMVIGDTWTISGTARAYLRHAAEVLDAEYRNN